MPVAPPRPRLPPLNSLRAFEAAARCGGFRAAADELSVTPAAVSQHVRALEDWTGTALFVRQSRGVTLTEEGARVRGAFTMAFDALGLAVTELRKTAHAPSLTIATLPAIAQLWLTPRLGRLRETLGQRQISVHALETAPNMLRDLYDISIFIGPTDSGLVLAQDLTFPVCAPAVAAKITSPEDLSRHVLLHDASWDADWSTWARACDVGLPGCDDGPRYSLYSLALAEAKAGAGIALGHAVLVQDALDDGSLVCPLPLKATTGQALIMQLGPAFSTAEAEAIMQAFMAG